LWHWVALATVVVGLSSAPARAEEGSSSAVIRSLEFTSDHRLICRNTTNLVSGGERYPELQWRRSPAANAPITHTVGVRVRVRLALELPDVLPGTPYHLLGDSDEPSLCFQRDGVLGGGTAAVVECEAVNPLGRAVRKICQPIRWTLVLHPETADPRTIDLGSTGPHVLYTTLGTPRVGRDPRSQVTDLRMELVVQRVAAAQEKVGFDAPAPRLVYELMRQNGKHYWPPRHYGEELAWRVPETWTLDPPGASCISIVEFVGLMCRMTGLPGETTTAAFYARADDPLQPLRGGLGDPPQFKKGPDGETWQLFLVDEMNTRKGRAGGRGGMNYYEAVLEYEVGGKRYYYPGGTDRVFDRPIQVVRIFRTLAWATWDAAAKEWVVREVVYTYHHGLDDMPRSITLP
jgi:hypothetical protein